MLPTTAQFSPSACLMSVTSSARAFYIALKESSLCTPGTCMTTSFSLSNTGPKDHLNLADINDSCGDGVEAVGAAILPGGDLPDEV